MSASLVGSEMCIRDRGPGARLALSGTPQALTTQKRQHRCITTPPERNCACLLYTSDAADDM
eukprot:2697601-Alexandrium_andersonii.AAC.1